MGRTPDRHDSSDGRRPSISLAMPMLARLRSRFRSLPASESGMALPTALFAMIASLALASAAIMSSVDVQQGTGRDHDSKEAIAAADAGAGLAMLRLNRFQNNLSLASPCVGPAGEAQAASGGWCPSTAAEAVGDAVFAYRVSAYNNTGTLKVIAVGTSGTVSRRVEVGFYSTNGRNPFADEKLIGQDKIDFIGGVDIRTGIGTNGDVTLNSENGKSAELCGDVRHGVGKTAPEPDCSGEKIEGEKSLPIVSPPENIAAENSNCRLAVTCNPTTEVDTYTTVKGKKTETGKRTTKEPWDAVHTTINIPNNSRLSMGGRDYYVCGLFVNGELIMNAGSEVRIFVRTPDECKLSSGAIQVEFTANATIVSTGFIPSQGTYTIPGIYVMGESTVKLSGNSGTNEMMLYAPLSNIEMKGDATYQGMIAGKSLSIRGNATIESDPNIKEPDISESSLLSRTRYVECTGAAASPPDANC